MSNTHLASEGATVALFSEGEDTEGTSAGIEPSVPGQAQDVLTGLVEKTKLDPGAPFVPEILKRLATLRKDDRAAFEALRSQLRKAGCRVIVLDKEIGKADGEDEVAGQPEEDDRAPTRVDVLIDLAQDAELFHGTDGTGYADIYVDDHRETWEIGSGGFRRWLLHTYYKATGGAPSSEAIRSAIGVLQARARFDAPERQANTRVAELDGRIYIDLADGAWRAVELDAAGWRVIDDPPVRFVRHHGMAALPMPKRGGSIETLRSFINVGSEADFVLVVAWIVACLRPRGPYPVLVLLGQQGSAKSTLSKVLRSLIDPNFAPLRALPRNDQELFIGATNGHLLAFDNVSDLPHWLSDTLCRLATGGGYATRQLYTDGDEFLFDVSRPVILNGIGEFVTRPDLADRAVFISLEPIQEKDRWPDQDLQAKFDAERPRILGALFDAVVKGLATLPHTQLKKLPRMADFALWATACEKAFTLAGTFASAYAANRGEAVATTIDADPVAAAVRDLITTQGGWTGTATELLETLSKLVGQRVRSRAWPNSPELLSKRLRTAAASLRSVGIQIKTERIGHAGTRLIYITVVPSLDNKSEAPSALSAPSAIGRDPAAGGVLAPPTGGGIVTSDLAVTAPMNAGADGADSADGADGASPQKPTQFQREAHVEDDLAIPEFLDRTKTPAARRFICRWFCPTPSARLLGSGKRAKSRFRRPRR